MAITSLSPDSDAHCSHLQSNTAKPLCKAARLLQFEPRYLVTTKSLTIKTADAEGNNIGSKWISCHSKMSKMYVSTWPSTCLYVQNETVSLHAIANVCLHTVLFLKWMNITFGPTDVVSWFWGQEKETYITSTQNQICMPKKHSYNYEMDCIFFLSCFLPFNSPLVLLLIV